MDYIKLNRSILKWEWYSDINTCRLFIYMLLRANWSDERFRGVVIPRGSFVSSIGKLAEATSLTEREVRTAIFHLKSTGEVTSKSTNKFTVFTVVNYGLYQSSDMQKDIQPPSKRQTNDKLTTTIEEDKKVRNKKELDVYYPNDEKLNQSFLDFLDMRKKIKKPMTERAITLAMKKLHELSALPFSDSMDNDLAVQILEQSTMNCWQGLFPVKATTDKKVSGGKQNKFNNFPQRDYDMEELEKKLLSR
ncbi:MAG: hypothetical protein UFG06_13870 [Lachnospiraceae bacterium]|nr:hypothetical protein [Lachnospiraceae bacterium]